MLQKARRKRRHDYPDAEVETERGVPHSLRRRRNIVTTLKLPRPESVETEIEVRSVSIRKARRKWDTIIQRDVKKMISLIQTALSHHSCIILQ